MGAISTGRNQIILLDAPQETHITTKIHSIEE